MSQALASYGPDGESTYFDSSLAIFYRAFHTTAESRREQQPFRSCSERIITWDGRLDNREDLLTLLGEPSCSGSADVEIVGKAFDRWGTDCFTKLSGDWAIVVWNSSSRQLVLARDYAGIRNLFYYAKSDSVTWCTHLQPLAVCGDRLTVSDEYVAGLLTLWPDSHCTPYEEIQAVPAGHFVRIDGKCVQVRRYWECHPKTTIRYKTDAEYEENFRELFGDAVRQRMRTDSPILADLSGGLDSTSIVCMADEIAKCSNDGRKPIDTFTALVSDEPGEEDSRYSAFAEKSRGVIGHHVEVSSSIEENPFETTEFSATPCLPGRPSLNAAKASIIQRGSYRVLLSGTGGDEMLGQALDPRVQLADLLRKLRFRELAAQLNAWSLLLRRPWIHLLSDAAQIQMPAAFRIRTTNLARLDSWINPDFGRRSHMEIRQLDLASAPLAWTPSARDWFQTVKNLANQISAHPPSVEEVRYPYLDRRLVEFLISIPTEQLLRPGQRRSLMRRALSGILPPEILQRKTKSGSSRYYSSALARVWTELQEILKRPLVAECGYVDRRSFYDALVAAKHGNLPICFVRLFRVLALELWLRRAVREGIVSIRGSAQSDLSSRPRASAQAVGSAAAQVSTGGNVHT
jgi:asparagine synthase (glutamine-hydrolysing)